MLKRTFIHLPGVGPRTEAHFWREGFLTWEDLLHAKKVRGLGWDRLDFLKARLDESLSHADDPAYFAPRLPVSDHWRLFRVFRPRTAYLDIETTGVYWPGLQVTVVGLYDGTRMRQYVYGQNLNEVPEALAPFDVVVTFNGVQFDLPVLRAYFAGLPNPPLHLDLRFILARLGFKGGLKRIEPQFGLRRPDEVNGMNGYMAVILWERYQRGDRRSLDLLLKYNREDVVNLEFLMEEAFRIGMERLFPEELQAMQM